MRQKRIDRNRQPLELLTSIREKVNQESKHEPEEDSKEDFERWQQACMTAYGDVCYLLSNTPKVSIRRWFGRVGSLRNPFHKHA